MFLIDVSGLSIKKHTHTLTSHFYNHMSQKWAYFVCFAIWTQNSATHQQSTCEYCWKNYQWNHQTLGCILRIYLLLLAQCEWFNCCNFHVNELYISGTDSLNLCWKLSFHTTTCFVWFFLFCKKKCQRISDIDSLVSKTFIQYVQHACWGLWMNEENAQQIWSNQIHNRKVC